MPLPLPIGYAEPTSRAFEGMSRILFRPFDLGKWFVLGFTAWLAGLLDGGSSTSFGGGPTGGGGESGSDGGVSDPAEALEEWGRRGLEWFQENQGLVLGVGGILLVLGIAVWLALLWVSSRGKFLFLDSVVHDRARVAEPWKRLRASGNSLFRWRLGFALVLLLAIGLLAGATVAIAIALSESEPALLLALFAVGGVAVFGIFLPALYIATLLEDLVIPVMYRDSLTATAAWGRVLSLHRARPGSIVLYVLWKILLSLAAGAIVLALGFGTCCLGFLVMAIPYLGAVLLLPLAVFFRLLGPHFLRQFGGDYDVFPRSEEQALSTGIE